jgi:hypothetical protein
LVSRGGNREPSPRSISYAIARDGIPTAPRWPLQSPQTRLRQDRPRPASRTKPLAGRGRLARSRKFQSLMTKCRIPRLRTERSDGINDATAHRERRVDQLVARLPEGWRSTVRWLHQPSRNWLRVCVGILLIVGSFLSILPVFGLWMLPLGLMLLAEDVPVLRRGLGRILEWIERRRPHWLQRAGSR